MPLFNDIIFDDNNIINENSIQNTELDNNNSNVKLVPNEKIDIIPLYKIADILITDMYDYESV